VRLLRQRLAALSPLAVALAACSDATGPRPEDVLAHRANWLAHHLTEYTYIYEARGFLISWEGQPIRIAVRNGVVVSATVAATGEPASPSPTDFPTIDKLFDEAADAARDHTLSAISFDDQLSYPRRMDLDGPPDARGSLIASQVQPVP
jgi:Family of unknown function (DUF6174)